MARCLATLFAALATLAGCSPEKAPEQAAAPAPPPQQSPAAAAPAAALPLFPLAIGNSWTFHCSAEGAEPFEKTLRLASAQEADGIRFFRAELVVGDDPNPVVTWYYADASAGVHQAPEPSTANSELLVDAAAKPGDAIGSRKAAAIEDVEVPALGKVQALRVENFAHDDPALSDEDRMAWDARYYAPGIGPVIEADGLGGECVLTKHALASP